MNAAQIAELVPIHKVVKAAIVDVYEDIGKTQQMFLHWACRGFKELQNHSLKKGLRKTLLIVNNNTNTATLPEDCEGEESITFVGVINSAGLKAPLRHNLNLVHTPSLQEISCSDDKCPKCNQNKSICEDLQVTEEVNLIVIENTTHEETVIKKLYPNGDYYLEKNTPYKNIDTDEIEYKKSKEFIAHLDLKPCGCLETTTQNLCKIKDCCPDVYCCYYAACDSACTNDYGGYKVFDENGLIQFDFAFKFDKVYIEYYGFIPKINGVYQVPQIAFECLVEYVKFRSVEGRRNIPNVDKQWRWNMYLTAKGNMNKILGRASLTNIIQSIMRTPKFDIHAGTSWYGHFTSNCTVSSLPVSTTSTDCITPATTSTATTTVINISSDLDFQKLQFEVGTNGSPMVAGQTVLTVNVSNVAKDSVRVDLDRIGINDFYNDERSYSIKYFDNRFVITFTNAVLDGDRYFIDWARRITNLNGGVSTARNSEIIYVNNESTKVIEWDTTRRNKFDAFPTMEAWVQGEDGVYYKSPIQPTIDAPPPFVTHISYDFGGNVNGFIVLK